MARRVNLDAMIRREDFASEIGDDVPPDAIRELTLEHQSARTLHSGHRCLGE